MKSMLEELYYGRINPYEAKFEKDPYYQQAAETLIKSESKLLDSLPEPYISTFIDFADAESQIADITALEKFSYGFKLGVLLGMELFSGDEINDY